MGSLYPKAFISCIELQDTSIPLERDSIVCFVGANGAGKSSLLSSIMASADGGRSKAGVSSLKQLSFKNENTHAEVDNLLEKYVLKTEGYYRWLGGNAGEPSFQTMRERLKSGCSEMNSFLVYFASIQNRLNGVAPPNHIGIEKYTIHPFHVLYINPEKEALLNSLVRSLFGRSIFLNPGAGARLPMHIASADAEVPNYSNRSQEYANEISKFPEITTDSDGIQATIGLLSLLVASHHSCMIIDEPDVFLHPPQAYQLGKVVAQQSAERQIVLGTHSYRFLQGLIETSAKRVKLVRLIKSGSDYSSKLVEAETIALIQDDPLLRFSEIAESLFYPRVFLCEDYNDCFFYSGALGQLDSQLSSNSLWMGVGGKSRFSKFANTCVTLGVSPICLADFDFLAPENGCLSQSLRSLLDTLGADASFYEPLLVSFYRAIEGNTRLDWGLLKDLGIRALSADRQLHSRVQELLKYFSEFGLMIVPFGEMESLSEPRFEKGIDGVYRTLQREIETDPELANAKKFLSSLRLSLVHTV